MISLFDEYVIMAMPGEERRAILARVQKSPLMLALAYVTIFAMLGFSAVSIATLFGGSPRSPIATAAGGFFHIALGMVFLCRAVLFRAELESHSWSANAVISPQDSFALNRFPLTVPGTACVLYGLWFMVSTVALSMKRSPPSSFAGWVLVFFAALCVLLSGRGYLSIIQRVLNARHARGECPRCRYPLDGASLCTECGLRIEVEVATANDPPVST